MSQITLIMSQFATVIIRCANYFCDALRKKENNFLYRKTTFLL